MKKFYITTPIYYVNDKPHIGHAYTTIAADVLARWKRLKGQPVFFLTGTDEHGSKIAQAALQSGRSPKDFVDDLALEFKNLWKDLNISNDDFIRTSEDRHVRLVRAVFSALEKKGEIYKGFYEDWYCVSCESFWLESDLKDGNCPDCGRPVQKLKEESYFFKLSGYQEKLKTLYADAKNYPGFLSGRQSLEIRNFVGAGLKDLSVSRLKEKWGIPVPADPKHTVYVWFDALLNYVTAAGYRFDEGSGNIRVNEEVWPCDVHFVGKEIFRFHAVIWPAMLAALGIPPPKKVFAHGWWTVEGEKMSKSKGNMIDPRQIAKEFGVDGLRYFLLKEIPFGMDGDFSRQALIARYNSDLANNLGNLFSRTLTLIAKFFDGSIMVKPKGVLSDAMKECGKKMDQAYDRASFHEVLDGLGAVVAEANRYIDRQAPWNLAKTNLAEAEKVLSECLVILRWLAVAYHPYMPATTLEMWDQIGESGDLAKEGWSVLQDPLGGALPGKKTRRGAVLFPRKEK